MKCPWYVTKHAVARYLEVTGAKLPYDAALAELTSLCAETWQRYQDRPEAGPAISHTGGWVYRGPKPRRLRFLVGNDPVESDKPQLVDVLPAHAGQPRVAPAKGRRTPGSIAAELVAAHGIDRAIAIAEDLSRPTANINIRVPPGRLKAYQAAAERAKVTFTAWVLDLLDKGAR